MAPVGGYQNKRETLFVANTHQYYLRMLLTEQVTTSFMIKKAKDEDSLIFCYDSTLFSVSNVNELSRSCFTSKLHWERKTHDRPRETDKNIGFFQVLLLHKNVS